MAYKFQKGEAILSGAVKQEGAISGSGDVTLAVGKDFNIAGSNVLNLTTLGSSVVGSSLTSVGTLTGLTSSSPIAANGGLEAGYAHIDGDISGSGDLTLGAGKGIDIGGATNVLQAASLGSTVLASSLTSVGTLSSLTTTGVISGSGDLRLGAGAGIDIGGQANVLSQATLGSTVLASSLTSVGTLTGVTSSRPIVAQQGLRVSGGVISGSVGISGSSAKFSGIINGGRFVGDGAGLTNVASVAGSNKYMQFNQNSSMAGASTLQYDGTGSITLSGRTGSVGSFAKGQLVINGDSTDYLDGASAAIIRLSGSGANYAPSAFMGQSGYLYSALALGPSSSGGDHTRGAGNLNLLGAPAGIEYIKAPAAFGGTKHLMIGSNDGQINISGSTYAKGVKFDSSIYASKDALFEGIEVDGTAQFDGAVKLGDSTGDAISLKGTVNSDGAEQILMTGSLMALNINSANTGNNSLMAIGGAAFGHEGGGVADIFLYGGDSGQAGTISGSGDLQLGVGSDVNIAGSNVLNLTTLGSSVLASSLTSVGTLSSLTTTGVISGSGDLRLGAGAGIDIGGQANVLSQATLGSTVLASSLTSVGTLTGVTSSSPIVASAGIRANTGYGVWVNQLTRSSGDLNIQLHDNGDNMAGFRLAGGAYPLKVSSSGVVHMNNGEVKVGSSTGAISGSGVLQAAGAASFNSTLSVNGGITLAGASDTAFAVASDSMYFRDADGTMHRDAWSDVVSASIADGGLASSGLSASNGRFALSIQTLQNQSLDVANDRFAFKDASDDNTYGAAFTALATAMAGTGLSAASGQLSLSSVGTVTGVGDANATLTEGLTYGTTTLTANRTWTLPASSGLSVGDVVRIKAPDDVSTFYVKITGSGAQTVDGGNPITYLESDAAAVALHYVAANKFKIF